MLYLLAMSNDHNGNSPLSLALSMPSFDILEVLVLAGLNLEALVAVHPQLLSVESSQALGLVSASGKFEIVFNPLRIVNTYCLEG